jgi:hypothetical protein
LPEHPARKKRQRHDKREEREDRPPATKLGRCRHYPPDRRRPWRCTIGVYGLACARQHRHGAFPSKAEMSSFWPGVCSLIDLRV